MSRVVTFLTRAGCHLCEEALPVLLRICSERDATVELVDIDTDPGLQARYTDEVPVVLIDGVQHSIWRVESERLIAALDE